MSSYKVFKHPEKGFEAVKSGFAWLAPFNPVWPLFRGLWMLFIFYIFVILIITSIDYTFYGFDGYIDIASADDLQLIFLIVQIIIFISPGFKGNEWTATNLQKKGYVFDCSIEANNKNEALTLVTSSKA
jgi:type IV secretory pathway VirB6-like protein